MKIAMISPTRESEKAISGYSVELVKAFNKNKTDVDLVTYKAGSFKSFLKLFKKLKNYDIVHIQHEYNLLGGYGIPFFFVYFYFLFFKKYIVITTMHTTLSLKEKFKGNFLKTFLRKKLYVFQNKIIDKASNLIFVHSDFFVPILVKDYNISKKKIVVLPQGILEGVKLTPKNKAKKELNLSGPVYLIIGNLVPDHGADIILKNAKEIGKTVLVVANPTPINDRKGKRITEYLNKNLDYIKKNNLKEYVRFDILTISDKHPKWWKYFSAADFILQPYKGGIGSGIFAHAMSAKKPVIASNIKFFLDIEEKYSCLKIAKTTNDYSKILHDSIKPVSYKKMEKGCEKYLKENSWSKISKKYKKIYNSLK